jgi:hypothetical protein
MADYFEDITPDKVSVVPSSAPRSDLPQFSTAEYAHVPGSERCRICNNFISGEYFRINNQMACSVCARQATAGQPQDSHAAFLRGLLLGIGAAVLGMILYATFTIVTNFYFGYIALGVGWLVARAIMKGSNGLGGRRYQIAAVLLTYAAISLAAIPVGISYIAKHGPSHAKPSTASNSSSASPSTEDADAEDVSSARPPQQVNWLAILGQLLFAGLASPFFALASPTSGAIQLFILFIGLRIAWRLTAARALDVDGPYPVSAA